MHFLIEKKFLIKN